MEAIKAATQELEGVSHKVAEVLYRSTTSANAAGAGGEAPGAPGADGGPGANRQPGKKPNEGEVIDAEYVDVDESKKPH